MTFSQDFIEKAVVLLLTAGLTGVLVPLLFWIIDGRRNKEQKIFEAELARQNKIIDSQVKFLEDLSSLLWEFQLLLIAVPYYRQFPERDLFHPALKAYEENAGKLLGKIRAEISKALRLTPYPIYQEIKELYYKQLLPLDLKVSQLAIRDARNQDKAVEIQTNISSTRNQDKISDWHKLNQYAVSELSEIVDNLINKLANELKLKAGFPEESEKFCTVDEISVC